MATDPKALDTFPGARYWKSMQGAVDAILTPMGIQRRVISTGTQFVNYDAWTGEAFAQNLCDFFAKHPDRLPTHKELIKILDRSNGYRCRDPHIRVARMPDRVTLRVARAIIGGGYHEAWHTKYSKRDRIRRSEVQPILDLAEQVILAGGQFDAKMRGLLMTLHHLVEDIRIERRGNEEFEGAKQAMVDLQDFILELEAIGREKGAKVKNVTVSMNARSIMLCAFRDLGLGYNSHKARQMIEFYKAHAPGAIALLSPGGLLAPMLHEAKHLDRDDKMGSLRVAMKIVVELWRVTQQESEEKDQGMQCPQCGAGPKELIIRSVKNDKGVKVKGRAELECKACGFKHEFDLPDNSLNLNQQEEDEDEKDEDEEKPEVEDLYEDDVGEGGDGFGDDAREKMRDQKQSQEGSGAGEGSGDREEGDEEQEGEGVSQTEGSDDEGDESEDSEGPASETEDGEDGEDGEDDPEFDDLNGLVNDEDEEGPSSAESRDDEAGEDEGEGSSASGGNEERGEDEDEEGDVELPGAEDDGDDESEEAGASSTESDTGNDAFDDAGGDLDDGDGSTAGSQSGQEDESEDGQDGDGDDTNGGNGSGQSQTAQDGNDEDGEDEDDGWEMSGEDFEEAAGAGGFTQDLGRDFDSDLRQAMEIFKGDDGDGRVTNQTALDEALADQNRRDESDVQSGERVWSPLNPMLDEAHIVRPLNPSDSLELANTMLAEVRGTVTYLRARLRTIVKAQEMTNVSHGVRRGRKLSQRMLVDTAVDIRSGRMPTRAYQRKDAKVDTSIDMAICLDQSSSMDMIQYPVAQVQMILAESVEGIGGGTFAFGFRNGPHRGSRPSNWQALYHRTQGVRYDVFKTWDEKFTNVKARFAHTAATGTTPMADGVQFGLMALEGRRAAHRVLAVITDGWPDRPHAEVIRRQIRIAREGGIQIIGIGIGHGAKYVFDLFGEDNAVWAATVEEMPNELLKKLNQLCDFSGRFRGRRPKLDGKGKLPRKVS